MRDTRFFNPPEYSQLQSKNINTDDQSIWWINDRVNILYFLGSGPKAPMSCSFWLIDNRILFKPETQHKVNKWRIKKGIFQTRAKDTFCRWSPFFFFLYVHDKISCPVLSFFFGSFTDHFLLFRFCYVSTMICWYQNQMPLPVGHRG